MLLSTNVMKWLRGMFGRDKPTQPQPCPDDMIQLLKLYANEVVSSGMRDYLAWVLYKEFDALIHYNVRLTITITFLGLHLDTPTLMDLRAYDYNSACYDGGYGRFFHHTPSSVRLKNLLIEKYDGKVLLSIDQMKELREYFKTLSDLTDM